MTTSTQGDAPKPEFHVVIKISSGSTTNGEVYTDFPTALSRARTQLDTSAGVASVEIHQVVAILQKEIVIKEGMLQHLADQVDMQPDAPSVSVAGGGAFPMQPHNG